jgi:hypothetical protein
MSKDALYINFSITTMREQYQLFVNMARSFYKIAAEGEHFTFLSIRCAIKLAMREPQPVGSKGQALPRKLPNHDKA